MRTRPTRTRERTRRRRLSPPARRLRNTKESQRIGDDGGRGAEGRGREGRRSRRVHAAATSARGRRCAAAPLRWRRRQGTRAPRRPRERGRVFASDKVRARITCFRVSSSGRHGHSRKTCSRLHPFKRGFRRTHFVERSTQRRGTGDGRGRGRLGGVEVVSLRNPAGRAESVGGHSRMCSKDRRCQHGWHCGRKHDVL